MPASEPIVKRLQLIAQIFTNALARKRSDEMLRESEERLSIAADSAEAGLWNYNISTGRFWLTEKARELFGVQLDEDVTFDRFLALVHPDDRDLVCETMQAVMHSKSEGRVEYRVLRPDAAAAKQIRGALHACEQRRIADAPRRSFYFAAMQLGQRGVFRKQPRRAQEDPEAGRHGRQGGGDGGAHGRAPLRAVAVCGSDRRVQ